MCLPTEVRLWFCQFPFRLRAECLLHAIYHHMKSNIYILCILFTTKHYSCTSTKPSQKSNFWHQWHNFSSSLTVNQVNYLFMINVQVTFPYFPLQLLICVIKGPLFYYKAVFLTNGIFKRSLLYKILLSLQLDYGTNHFPCTGLVLEFPYANYHGGDLKPNCFKNGLSSSKSITF